MTSKHQKKKRKRETKGPKPHTHTPPTNYRWKKKEHRERIGERERREMRERHFGIFFWDLWALLPRAHPNVDDIVDEHRLGLARLLYELLESLLGTAIVHANGQRIAHVLYVFLALQLWNSR